jgi:predicted exporter
LWQRIDRLPRLPWLAPALIVIALAGAWLARTPMWENDLGKLTPVPLELIQQDQALRGALGAADVRYLLVVSADDTEQVLQRLEALQPALDKLVASGAIAGFDHAARYLPSTQTQLARQAMLPDAERLRADLAAAQAGTGFREGVFAPFIADVERAKTLPALTPETIAQTPLGTNLDMLLIRNGAGTQALVSLNGVENADALAALADANADVLLLDLKGASETLVARQRAHILWSLAAAALLLVGVVALSLRRAQRVYRVLAPMSITTFVIIAILLLSGSSLSLFHLIALMLAAGLGLDYALFFEHAADDGQEQRRTLHAVIVCSLSTLMVFALLAFSTIPVLRAIGVTVAIGVVSNFVLALLLAREPSRAAHN